MGTIESDLIKSGIEITKPLDTLMINAIAKYVSNKLTTGLPSLHLDAKALFIELSRMPMYFAKMPEGISDASYFYKNSTIYFRDGKDIEDLKKFAVHEFIHHIQEVKDKHGNIVSYGHCHFTSLNTHGMALNEGAVQLISATINDEEKDTVKYFDITLPTDSPHYYPLLCNLVKQIAYITGFDLFYDSTIYTTPAFFNKISELCGHKNAIKIRENLDRLLDTQDMIVKFNCKLQYETLNFKQCHRISTAIDNCKEKVKTIFLQTQNMIFSSYFNQAFLELASTTQIEEFRKYLYSFKNLIGTTDNYNFFNEYYIDMMAKLDHRYEEIINKTEVTVYKKSKLQSLFHSIKKLLGLQTQTEQ